MRKHRAYKRWKILKCTYRFKDDHHGDAKTGLQDQSFTETDQFFEMGKGKKDPLFSMIFFVAPVSFEARF